MDVVAVCVPEVPVIVTVDSPAVAAPSVDSVNMLVEVVGLVSKEALTPLGNPLAARVTAPVKPLISFTVMVVVATAPGTTCRLAAEVESVKPVVPPPPVELAGVLVTMTTV